MLEQKHGNSRQLSNLKAYIKRYNLTEKCNGSVMASLTDVFF